MRMRTGLAAWPSAVFTTSTSPIPARLHGTSTVTSSNPGNGRPPRNIALARLVPRSARAFRPMSRDYLHGIGMQKSAGLRAGAPRDDGGQRLSDYRQNRGGVGPCAPPQNRAVSGAPSRGLAPRRSRGPAAPGGDRQKAYAASGFHDGYEWLKGDLAVTIEASEKGRVGEICGCFGRVRRGDWLRGNGERPMMRNMTEAPRNRLGADGRYFLVSTAARNRSSDSTSAGSATVSAISWRKSSRYLLRSL